MSAPNTVVIELNDGRSVLTSYGVPVAAFIPGRGYLRTNARYSVTTSKHMNAWAGKDAPGVPDAEFMKLIAPVVKTQ